MIDFSCHCGSQLSVPQELAGSVIQCPDCKRLNDVPTISDLANIDEKGVYKLDQAPGLSTDPNRIARLTKVYTRSHFDESGEEIDLRESFDQPAPDAKISGPVPVESLTPLDEAVPKYDPVTGELIRPIDVKTESQRAHSAKPVPLAQLANNPRRRAMGELDRPPALEAIWIFGRLLQPANLLVIGFILLAHLFCQVMLYLVFFGNWILVPFWGLLHLAIVSHYGNVTDETGPADRDELPAPLRSLSYDDTVGPFIRFAVGIIVAYGPAIAILIFKPAKVPLAIVAPIAGVLAIVATFVFPAVLITTMVSGIIPNLRPDRILGVIRACGAEYLLAALTWTFGGLLWLAASFAVDYLAVLMLDKNFTLPRVPYLNAATAWSALIVATFLMHFFCWHIGVLYRKHHERFPWILQRASSSDRQRPQGQGFQVLTRAQRNRGASRRSA